MDNSNSLPNREQTGISSVSANRKIFWILVGTVFAIAGAIIWLACKWQICYYLGIPYPCCK